MGWLRRIAAAIVIGVAANLIVAWACVLRTQPLQVPLPRYIAPTRVHLNVPPTPLMYGLDTPHIYVFTKSGQYEGFGTSMTRGAVEEQLKYDHVSPDNPRVFSQRFLLQYQAGWPFRSLACVGIYDNLDRPPCFDEGVIAIPKWLAMLTPTSPWTSLSHKLPIRPIPLGFAANSILFAAIALQVLITPGLLREYLRRRRGQCLSCAYDRRSLPTTFPCPECGATPKT